MDELADTAGRGWVPYVSPLYGGVNARVLNVHRDPGPKTDGRQGGSGFLCTENDDASAERFATLLEDAGIAVSQTLSWNAYPWYINRLPRAAELEAGAGPLRQLLGLLPGLRVVMLYGGSAQDGWKRLARLLPARHPGLRSCPRTTPAIGHSSGSLIFGKHAWQRSEKHSRELHTPPYCMGETGRASPLWGSGNPPRYPA